MKVRGPGNHDSVDVRSGAGGEIEDRREFEMALLTLWRDFLPKAGFEDHLPKR